jgi:hypothetical protein
VADAKDGDEFSFEPQSRRLTNETQGKSYDPVPLSPKEDEIRQTGGIFAAGRREFKASVDVAPRIEWPDPEQARRMTSTEQIVWAPSCRQVGRGRARATLRVYADLLPGLGRHRALLDSYLQPDHRRQHDLPRQAAIANDHFVFTGKDDDDKQTAIGRDFARLHGIVKPYYATPATASSISIFRSRRS